MGMVAFDFKGYLFVDLLLRKNIRASKIYPLCLAVTVRVINNLFLYTISFTVDRDFHKIS